MGYAPLIPEFGKLEQEGQEFKATYSILGQPELQHGDTRPYTRTVEVEGTALFLVDVSGSGHF